MDGLRSKEGNFEDRIVDQFGLDIEKEELRETTKVLMESTSQTSPSSQDRQVRDGRVDWLWPFSLDSNVQAVDDRSTDLLPSCRDRGYEERKRRGEGEVEEG